MSGAVFPPCYLPGAKLVGFPCGSAGKVSDCNGGDLGSIPGLRRYPGEAKGYPLQYYGLENSMDYTVHGVAESDTTEQFSLKQENDHLYALFKHLTHCFISLYLIHQYFR